ncbi:hypothetical protein NDU88_001454 [Pleurodeles waltl]|uniref:Uncharacterized protein n=1 Tax=Pleurodeles waltl TaxID=8319 RepID=A0AAV7W137_PLEWA|nr:hypothetical protein NDU88_001454 [Pleurodeles waltl]
MVASRQPDTPGAEQGSTHLGNPDIRIPVVQIPAECPRREKEDARAEEETDEEDARAEDETKREDAEARERRSGGPHEELTPGETLDGVQGSLETQRLCHIHGGACLQQGEENYLIRVTHFLLICTLTFLTRVV